jgi:thymidylate synthase (FAD)
MTNPTILDHGFLNHYAHDNDDLTVVNAARVSMGKRVDKILLAGTPEAQAREDATGIRPDDGLINYLAKHRHWTPFGQVRVLLQMYWCQEYEMIEFLTNMDAGTFVRVDKSRPRSLFVSTSLFSLRGYQFNGCHPLEDSCPLSIKALADCPINDAPAWGWQSCTGPLDWCEWPEQQPITLHIRWPLFVARQAMRHNVGIDWNEVSRRYVTEEPVFHLPDRWRAKAKSVKQGSSDAEAHPVVRVLPGDSWMSMGMDAWADDVTEYANMLYSDATDESLDNNVCPEQARMILPQSLYTECIATFTRPALARFIRQRIKPDAQWEIRQYAERALAVGVEVFGGEFAKECESQ